MATSIVLLCNRIIKKTNLLQNKGCHIGNKAQQTEVMIMIYIATLLQKQNRFIA